MSAPTDVNYGESAFWTWDDRMWDHLRWLRENDPIHWSEASDMFIISKFEDLSFVSKNHQIFCSSGGVLPGNPARLSLIDEDEPRHGQLRGLINKGFTPRMTAKLEEVFARIVTETIDAVADKGTCDFVDDLAVPPPLLIIAEMIGIRPEDRKQFHQWSDAMILAQGNMEDPAVVENAGKAFGEYALYINEIIEDRRKNPKDDLVSILVGAKDEGHLGTSAGRAETDDSVSKFMRTEEEKALNADELTMFCVLLLVAGNETTRNGISGGMKLLMDNPDIKQALTKDPEKIPAACEEMLRLTSPVIAFCRTATRDTEIKDTKIKEGQKVFMLYPSANRDADEFKDPDKFDIDRNPQHVAFGIGNHFCLGANLARMELRVSFREILRRMPDMHYAGDGPEMAPSALVRSFQHMQVAYTPES